jgi:uncharacterized protein YceH (UPF0502 family)
LSVALDLTAAEIRVLGCLLEKERTTPEDYPLTRNAVMRAANQSTSRDPVVAYDEAVVEEALTSLRARGLTRIVYSPSNRAPKYRHVLDEAWGLAADDHAVLCVLALRGPQTTGEIKQRSERLYPFADLDAVALTLARLGERDEPLVAAAERIPGRKEARWVATLGEVAPSSVMTGGPGPAGPSPTGARLEALEGEVAALRVEVDRLAAILADLGA